MRALAGLLPLILLLLLTMGASTVPATTVVALTLEPPPGIMITHVEVRGADHAVVASCGSAEACRTFVGKLSSRGRHALALDYTAADGVAEHFDYPVSAGYGESSITIGFDLDQDGVIRYASAQITAAPIAGVALRIAGPSKYGEAPPIELVNGSSVPIVVRVQGHAALVEVSGGSHLSMYAACGTGVGFRQLLPGESIGTMRLAAMGRLPALEHGHYVISAHYGLDMLQEATSGGTRTAQLAVDVDGPAPEPEVEPPLSAPSDPMARVIQDRDPGRPPRDFAPATSEGATSPRRARSLRLSTIVSGILTPDAAHRYFRVRIPVENNYASVRFYARCTGPGCHDEAYSVLTDDPDSVSDARDLRGSGGWTRLTDDTDMFPRSREVYLVVGCVRRCSQPIAFTGHVYAWTMPGEDPTPPKRR